MTKTKKQTETVVDTVKVFGKDYTKKTYSLAELITMTKSRFNKNYEIGKMAYFILAFRRLGLVSVSYEALAQILTKMFELEGMQTNTTAKCMAYYNGRINKGFVNISEDFKQSGRHKEQIDMTAIFSEAGLL